MFRVFDEHNTRYNMQLLKLFRKKWMNETFFGPGWSRFVKDHNLGAGDQISFDKNLDTTISDDFYYILKYDKKPESSKKPGDGAESSRKRGDTSESSTKLSDDSVQRVLGIGMPVFKVIYHRILLETHRKQRIATSPGSRPFQLEAICLSKTLTAAEVGSWLFFDVYDAIILADNPRVAEVLSGDISVVIRVFDRDDRRYDMILRPDVRWGGITGFYLDGWREFIENHDLRQGDRIAFYKFLDRRIHYGYYYVVLKLPADVDCQNRRNPFRPGSRNLHKNTLREEYLYQYDRALNMPESYCFSKILSEDDVSPEAAGLQLETLQARHFESSRRSLNEPFMVFDRDDRQYDMKLSYYFNRGVRRYMCFLDNAGWHSFVLRNNLRAGDLIHVYKTFDQSVCADHYFVFAFTIIVKF